MIAWLTPARRVTLAWIGAGSVAFVATAAASSFFWPDADVPAAAADRLAAALLLLHYPAAFVVLVLASCFRIFDTEGALDPANRAESPRLQKNQRVLTNTVEHMAFFVPALGALAVVADTPATFRFVPMGVALFVLGRVLFWIGYHVSPNARSIGFNLSFSTALVTLVLAFALA